jgi:F420-non-reducing hydrogenase iron-sulfur subunit
MRAKERVEHAKELLDELGIGADRLEMYHIGASDAPLWAERVEEMTERVQRLGPNPLRVIRAERARKLKETGSLSGDSQES